MRVAIVGSREWPQSEAFRIEAFIAQWMRPDNDILISGGARGVDTIAWEYAGKRGITRSVYQPDWNKHGKKAGPIRNQEIVDNCDCVVAFWDGQSRGTADTIAKAMRAGKFVRVFMPKEWP